MPTSTSSAIVYRTSGGEVLVLDGDTVIMSMDGGQEYYKVATSDRRDTVMHVYAPGLNILVAMLRKDANADAYVLRGVNDVYPEIDGRPFVRTDETFGGEYHPLPEFVPMVAFLAQDGRDAYVLAILEFNSRDWSVFLLDGDPYTNGATGTKKAISNLGSAGVSGVTFRLDGHAYELAGGSYSPVEYRRGEVRLQYHDPEQFRIVFTESEDGTLSVKLTPLAHARRP